MRNQYPRLRAGVIGTGFIAAVHAEAVRRVGAELVGVAGSSARRGADGAARIGTFAFASVEDLLASDIDVVHIASPNAWHTTHALAALEAGKHVICEKPLATSVADARRMLDAADRSGRVHATCFNIRYYPMVHEARARLAAAEIGAVHMVTGSYLQDWLLKPTDWNWRLNDAAGAPTRAIADIGSHWLDLAQFVIGSPVTRVFADLQTVHRTRLRPIGEVETFAQATGSTVPVAVDSDDAGTVLLRFASGAHGVLVVSQVAAGRKNDLHLSVDGALGGLAWDSPDPDVLWNGHRDGANHVIRRNPADLDPAAADVSFYPAGHVEGFGETFRGLVQHVYADIAAGSRRGGHDVASYPTFRDGLRAMVIDEAVARSAATEAWTDVEEM